MSLLKPKALFRTVGNDHLVQRLPFDVFDEDDELLVGDSNGDRQSSNFDASPIIRRRRFQSHVTHNSSCSSASDDERAEADRLDSSTDSAVGGDQRKGKLNFMKSSLIADYRLKKKSRGMSPPYKGVRALRLFGSPQSPKSLLKQSELSTSDVQNRICSRFSTPNGEYNHDHNRSFSQARNIRPSSTPKFEANINPFTKTGMRLNSKSKKRRLTTIESIHNDSVINSSVDDFIGSSDDDEVTEMHPFKRIHLTEPAVSRYETDFVEICKIGSGEFGSVYKCRHRLDGIKYALKKTRKPMKGTAPERTAINEVYAHAVLGRHTHVVRYYSAWAENNCMLIQNEFCSGGSLADAIEHNKETGKIFNEADLKLILLHVSLGLKYIHSVGLVHMDIKPGNIFITRNESPVKIPNFLDNGFEDDEDILADEFIYKIGDLGHVTSVVCPEVEEGDCRYLPKEILQDIYQHLPKVDVFALGLTIFEAGGGGPLPKNGPDWHSIRDGNLPHLPQCSVALNNLLKEMINSDPELRPTSAALAQHETLVPYGKKTKAQLSKELNVEKLKNEVLSRQLQNIMHTIPKRSMTTNCRKSLRTFGSKLNRSISVTNF